MYILGQDVEHLKKYKKKIGFKYVYLHHVKPAIEPPTPHDKQGALAGAATQKAGTDRTNPRTPTSPHRILLQRGSHALSAKKLLIW